MKNISLTKKLIAVAGFIVMACIGLYAQNAQAFTTTTTITGELHGYAWSSTTGWISLNCAEGSTTGGSICSTSDYKVVRLSTGVISGQAWSANLGWLSFDTAQTSVCATGSTQTRLDFTGTNANKLVGWAIFMSGYSAGGWDGCMKLKSTGTEPAYGVIYNSTATPNIIGNAWGSVVTGWVGFYGNYGTTVGGAVDLKVNGVDGPITVASGGGPATLSYTTSSGVTSCSGTGLGATASPSQTDWSSTTVTPATGASVPITVPANTGSSTVTRTYTITCTNGTATSTDNVIVNVTASNAPFLDFKVNDTYGPITIDSGVTGVTLKWTTQNVQANTCVKSSSPAYTGWNTNTPATTPTNAIPSAYTSSTSTPVTATYATGILSTTQTFTISGCIPAGGGTALAAQTRTVNMYAPSCRVVGPVVPAVSASSTGAVSGTVNFGVVWDHTGGVFYPATLSMGSLPTGFSGSLGHTATSDCRDATSPAFKLTPTYTTAPRSQCTGITVSGTVVSGTPSSPNLNVTIGANVSPAVSGVTSCTPAILEIVPPGGTATGSTTPAGTRRAPWQEF
jgi:hypothetical protein